MPDLAVPDRPPARPGSADVRGRADALLSGTLAFVISVLGAGRPSLWVDEAATVSATDRPLAELWRLLHSVDAVHGLYYLLLHGWSALTPPGELWLRLPSAVLVGVAAAGVVVLGRQLSTRSVSLAAAVVFALLPRTTWAGIEARPYALTMACAVWLTVLLIVAVRRGSVGLWAAYGLGLIASVGVNVMVLLILVPHAVVVIGAAPTRRARTAWMATVAAAAPAVVALVVVLTSQQGQVSWIWPVGPATAGQIFAEQYFPSVYSDSVRAVGPGRQQFTAEQLAVAMRAWMRVVPLISLVIVLAVVAGWKRHRGTAVIPTGARLLVAVSATWVLAPTVLLVGFSAFVRPLYQPHYLAFSTPAVALLIGLGVVVVGRDHRRIGVILALLAVAAAPNYLAQRGPYAKYGSDYSQVAGVLAAHSAPGECLSVVGADSGSTADGLAGARLIHRDRLVDIGTDESARQRDSLFGSRLPDHERPIGDCAVVWVVTATATADGRQATPGFRVQQQWRFNQSTVAKEVRVR